MISQTSSRELFDEIHCDIYIEVKIFFWQMKRWAVEKKIHVTVSCFELEFSKHQLLNLINAPDVLPLSLWQLRL